jgi:putative phosphoesterase
MPAVKIGVLSDTHLYSAQELPLDIVRAFSDVDLIIHTGDFVSLPVLEGLKKIKDVKAVQGNMDSADIRSLLPEKEVLEINGKWIGIIHGSGGSWGIENKLREHFENVDAIVYGHTHQARNELLGDILFFNPGKASYSYGILLVDEDIRGQIVHTVF